MKNRRNLMLGAGVCAVILAVTAYAAIFNVLAVANMPDSEVINGPATLTFRQLIMSPGEVSSWHYHPGVMISAVKRGTVTVEDGCGGGKTSTVGEGFESVEERIHRAVAGSAELEEFNLFITPQGMAPTVPVTERLCGPPRNISECRHGGWTTFTHPRPFANQGDCIQFVVTRKLGSLW